MIRLFAALAAPSEIVDIVSRRQVGLPGAHWRPPGELHVTLCFFGEITETAADDLDVELSRINAAAVSLELSGAGAFDEGDRMRAVWAGVVDNPELRLLAQGCQTAARRAGLKPDRRAWRPHITLAYLRGAEPAAVGAWIQAQGLLRSPKFQLNRFGLYSSQRGAKGARYRLERTYWLLEADATPSGI